MNSRKLKKIIKIEAARRSFFEYCHLLYPKFYKKDREYLVKLCNELQEFIEDPDVGVLFLSEPPRHGKSFTVQNLETWLLGRDDNYKIMSASYNEDIAKDFSKKVRNTIQTDKADPNILVYKDIFQTEIKKGSSAAKMWQTSNSPVINYLATSPTGSSTGFGANIIVVDDLIKSAAEALNERVLEKHWEWFKDTMLSRLEGENKKIIIIGTRWSKRDLIGRYKIECQKIGKKFKEINIKAYDPITDKMLCDEILDKKGWEELRATQSEEIFEANYQQNPLDVKNMLYTRGFDTYRQEDIKDISFNQIISYTDTADEGDDYLCSIFAGVYKRELYLLDVIYTKHNMEQTEPLVAETINRLKSTFNEIESNNGGKGFARNVRSILENTFGNYISTIHWFHQSNPKMGRILGESATVQRKVKVPINWHDKWPEFANDIMSFKRIGNLHDDAPDCLTGLVELALHKRLIDK